jgi:hypothetical protein
MLSNKFRAAIISTVVAGGAIGGALLASPMVSGAQEATTTTTPTAPATAPSTAGGSSAASADSTHQAPQGAHDPSQGGHVGSNGTKEELLTGTTADQVKAAALAANPGATIQRVENDAEGATYEAHITKADGTQATVKLDASFAVTATESGR